ncbi:MAG: tRNA modification GTPase [Cytophagaceae bacterium]|nr:tRNA modification GTPase [Cytophagaceae bacterium]
MLREDRSLLAIAHLSQLLDIVTCIGGFIVPLVLWLTQRDKVMAMDAHGKSIINFQISMFLYCLLCIPLILLFGLGILGLIGIGIIAFVFPIINAIKASNGELPYYPLNISFIK